VGAKGLLFELKPVPTLFRLLRRRDNSVRGFAYNDLSPIQRQVLHLGESHGQFLAQSRRQLPGDRPVHQRSEEKT